MHAVWKRIYDSLTNVSSITPSTSATANSKEVENISTPPKEDEEVLLSSEASTLTTIVTLINTDINDNDQTADPN